MGNTYFRRILAVVIQEVFNFASDSNVSVKCE